MRRFRVVLFGDFGLDEILQVTCSHHGGIRLSSTFSLSLWLSELAWNSSIFTTWVSFSVPFFGCRHQRPPPSCVQNCLVALDERPSPPSLLCVHRCVVAHDRAQNGSWNQALTHGANHLRRSKRTSMTHLRLHHPTTLKLPTLSHACSTACKSASESTSRSRT